MKVKDIAKALGVSPATISLVMNNKSGVSDTMREKVWQGIVSLGLDAPEKGPKRTILLAIYRIHGIGSDATPYFSQVYAPLIEGIERQAKIRGCNLMISYLDKKGFDKQCENLNNTICDGMLILGTEMSKEQFDTIKTSVPIVIIDNFIKGQENDCITIYNEEGVRLAIEHLVNLGHKEIGYIHVDHNANNFTERARGFAMAMEDCGLVCRKEYQIDIVTKDGGVAASKAVEDQILEASHLPTAFFADNDILAFHAINALKKRGLRIPEDISIIGFDNLGFAEVLDPPLTTIQIPSINIGISAVNTICESMAFVDSPFKGKRRINIIPSLIVRGSTKEPKNA